MVSEKIMIMVDIMIMNQDNELCSDNVNSNNDDKNMNKKTNNNIISSN